MVKLGEVGDDAARVPSSAFFVEHAAPAEAAAGIANGGHQARPHMLAGDFLKDEHVTIDLGSHEQLMEDVPHEKRLTLGFPHISAWVPDLFGAEEGNAFTNALKRLKGSKAKEQKAKERQVISLISSLESAAGSAMIAVLSANVIPCMIAALKRLAYIHSTKLCRPAECYIWMSATQSCLARNRQALLKHLSQAVLCADIV